MKKYNIYMGYDMREKLAYEVAEHSILSKTEKKDVSIKPINMYNTKHILDRPYSQDGEQLWDDISKAPMSTAFAIARFAIPFLQKSGWALFMDSDMVCLRDIKELFELADDKYAVMCVKHDYTPKEGTKFDMIQTVYPKKNWSSLILWNLDHPSNKKLTKEALNTWRGLDFHQFKWLEDDEIGELPTSWNFLVDVSEGELKDQKMVHYTNGCPAWGNKWTPKESDYIFNEEYEKLIANSKEWQNKLRVNAS